METKGLSFTQAQLQISWWHLTLCKVSILMNIQSVPAGIIAMPSIYAESCRLCRNSANLNRFTLKTNMPKHSSKRDKY